MAGEAGQRRDQQTKERDGGNGLNNIEKGEHRGLPARPTPEADAHRQPDQQTRQQRAKQQGQMLTQGVIKHLLAVGILFQ